MRPMWERISTLTTPFTGKMNSKIAVYLPSNGGVSRKPTYTHSTVRITHMRKFEIAL